MEKFQNSADILTRTPHFEGDKIFGSTKRKLNLPLGLEFDLHRPEKTNFCRPRVETRSAKAQKTIEVLQEFDGDEDLDFGIEHGTSTEDPLMVNLHLQNSRPTHVTGVEESDCDVTDWHITRVPKHRTGVACWALQAISRKQCTMKIIQKKKATACPSYTGIWTNYHTGKNQQHEFYFCPDDIHRCVQGTSKKWVLTRPDTVPKIWPVKRGTNLKRSEIIALERAGFQLPQKRDASPRRHFQSTVIDGIDLAAYHVPEDADKHPTSRFTKAVKRCSGGPIAAHLQRWGSALTLNARIQKHTMVPFPGLGCILDLDVDSSTTHSLEHYILTLSSIPACTCLDFVTMQAKANRSGRSWVNCKHLYFVYAVVCKLDEMEDLFVHAPTLSFNELNVPVVRATLSYKVV